MDAEYRARHRAPHAPRRRLGPAVALAVTVAAVVGAGAFAGRGLLAGDRGLTVSAPPATRPPATGAASPTPSPSAAGAVTIAAVGDTMLGNTPQLPPFPQTYFSAVRSALRAPIVFGNLEGTLTDDGTSKCARPTPSPTSTGAGPSKTSPPPPPTCFAFRVPPSYAGDLARGGFTIMNNANNHSFDFGTPGLLDTLAALHGAGIAHTGLPEQITIQRAGKIRVAFVGFAPYANTASLLDLSSARTLIRQARAEADIVVVYMHAGAEGSDAQHITGAEEFYVGEDRGNPRAFAHMAIAAGADLVIASGPHVLRGMEFYRGHLVAYSLGDFAGYHNFSTSGALAVSAVLRVRLSGDGAFVAGKIVPVRLTDVGQPVRDALGAAIPMVRSLSRADFGSAAARITRSGEILPPA
ncbi:MAG TPA: CapA family protein [Actinomycetota bacterium]